ncbi:hypothetical protein B7P43_G03047 [Cryptotermes secundus]|uniref:Uncharacterized protein n=1 Tax=Cryptotermes secundus TaxID=105785 RepID=A0A2J7Q4X1_9NEOP|nr:hypothetical protein B7P43_G03047 [Cryptotermes secundus]
MKHGIFHQNFTSLNYGGENYQTTETDLQTSPAGNIVDDQIAFIAILCIVSKFCGKEHVKSHAYVGFSSIAYFPVRYTSTILTKIDSQMGMSLSCNLADRYQCFRGTC